MLVHGSNIHMTSYVLLASYIRTLQFHFRNHIGNAIVYAQCDRFQRLELRLIERTFVRVNLSLPSLAFCYLVNHLGGLFYGESFGVECHGFSLQKRTLFKRSKSTIPSMEKLIHHRFTL
jgi:hypothetical protein